jgi:uncharacterized damage-inducible protein DinB
MDILDRLLGHDAWTNRHLLARCRELSEAQFDQPFDLGHGSLRATFEHMIDNIEVWTALMRQWPLAQDSPQRAPSLDQLVARLAKATVDFAALAHQIAAEQRLDDVWTDVLDNPPRQKSYGGAIAHVLTHNMAHRSEILHLLARLGLPDLIEGDLLSWEQQEAKTAPSVAGKKAIVVTAYQASNPEPIVMGAGEQVQVEDRATDAAGWVWCTHPNGKSGWTPIAFLRRAGDIAVALRDYSAVELSLEPGDELLLLEYESGWYWAVTSDGQLGWGPAEHLKMETEPI